MNKIPKYTQRASKSIGGAATMRMLALLLALTLGLFTTGDLEGNVIDGGPTEDLAVSAMIVGPEVTALDCKDNFATGGDVTVITQDGTTYCVHSFIDVGTSNFEVLRVGGLQVDYLIVGGGGSGGGSGPVGAAGGGGAGGVVLGDDFLGAGSYGVTVGIGGATKTGNTSGNDGASSAFNGVSAAGGGGGGGGGADDPDGRDGGSGGGAGRDGTGGSPTTGQGSAGGNGSTTDTGADRAGAGGGGAGAPGQSAHPSNGTAGFGGAGFNVSTFDQGVLAGGGGGGARPGNTVGIGAAGGGDGGGGNGEPAQPNTGSGGGGASGLASGIGTTGGAGGSGIVVVRYDVGGLETQLDIEDGNNQTAVVGTEVETAPSVLVTDVKNNPVEGVDVIFSASGNGSVDPTKVTTGADGIAVVDRWTLGTSAGTNTLIASAAGLDDVEFTASAVGLENVEFTWKGGASGDERDWFTLDNWDTPAGLNPSDPPSGIETIIIPGDPANQPLVASADPQSELDIRGMLTLENDATLTVEEGPLLRISDGATVTTVGSGADQGRIILESGARYVNLSNQTPLLQAERQLTGSRGWRMISSPVDTDYADFTNEIQTQGFPNADLAEANPGNPENFTPNFMWWDETDAGTTLKGWRTVNYDGSGDPAEDLVNIPVLAGRGHFYFNFDGAGRPDDNTQFYTDNLPLTMQVTGIEPDLSEDAFTFNPLTFTKRDIDEQTEGTGAGADGTFIDRIEADQGWNLVGNPTASALDWTAASGWTKTNISETIYVWDPSTNDYLVSNGINGNLPDNRIAPWQAFWVQATAASPALSFTNDVKTIEPYLFIGGEHAENGMAKSAAKTADGDAAQASLNSQEAGPQTIALTLTGAGMTASNWLMFSDNGRNGLDRYDAFRLEPLSDTWISAATSMEPGGPSLVINSLPEHATGLMSLPYYVGAARDGVPYNGSFELKWTISEEWADGRHITLMDHQQERAIDMLAESSYSFGHITEPEVAPAAMISQSDSDQRANGNHNLGKSMTGDSTLSKKEISTISTTDRPEIVHGLPRLPGNIAFRGQGSFGSDGSAEYGERQPSTGSNSGSQTWNDLRNGTVISESMSDAATAASTVAQTGERPRFSIVISAEASQDYISDEPMLKASYPNPFNSSTTIPFTLPSEQRVTIEVFDILGRRVSTLVNSELSAGVHEVRWNVRNSASGVYIIRMVSREGVQSSRITLVK